MTRNLSELKLSINEMEADINTLSCIECVMRSNYSTSGLRELISELVAYRNGLVDDLQSISPGDVE